MAAPEADDLVIGAEVLVTLDSLEFCVTGLGITPAKNYVPYTGSCHFNPATGRVNPARKVTSETYTVTFTAYLDRTTAAAVVTSLEKDVVSGTFSLFDGGPTYTGDWEPEYSMESTDPEGLRTISVTLTSNGTIAVTGITP
jgi:hypothetical protein